jgi:(E)-4-hydroxy-3-methylbut-2-enyl-diphosphate synthase
MCGRCEIDIPGMTEEVERLMHSIEKEYLKKGMPLEKRGGVTVAVMGCNVNGPGEAKSADIGIAGGRGGSATIFIKGRVHATLPEGELLERFSQLVHDLIDETSLEYFEAQEH